METRPVSVTAVGWTLVGVGLLSLLALPLAFASEAGRAVLEGGALPAWAQIAISAVGALVTLAAGVLVLRGQGWARLAYAGWHGGALALALATSPFKSTLIVSALFLAVTAGLLFAPAANRYFARR